VIADEKQQPGDRLANFARRRFLWLLLGAYALAVVVPSPGLAMREWSIDFALAGGVPISITLMLLAVMLFSAALLTDVSQIRLVSHHPIVLAVALVAIWLAPALLVVAAGWLIPPSISDQSTAGLLVGLALVASMPVANSSVGWTQNARGNLGLALALVVLSIVLCPWVTPNLLNGLGMSLSENERAYSEKLVNEFSGWFFVVWVILPTAAGLVCRWIFTPTRVGLVANWFIVTSAVALWLLNYINSAVGLPRLKAVSTGVLLTTAALAATLSIVGLAVAWLLAWIIYVKPATRLALMFGLSMKHTGLALILAGEALTNEPLAILLIVLATLLQHIAAAVVQWYSQPVGGSLRDSHETS
jgi:BASS family bile acid:Na+ symporter